KVLAAQVNDLLADFAVYHLAFPGWVLCKSQKYLWNKASSNLAFTLANHREFALRFSKYFLWFAWFGVL
ncbi:MAG: hypothetical protein KC449_30280, partial [Anaerolineales bacterium]|nr:hypothetical protein [Anaerolineales bacterium]